MANWNQKEQLWLKDQKSHEEMCIKKYNNYANQAQDPQLKQIFQGLAQKEQEHYNSINQMLSGQTPNVQQGQQQQPQQQQQQQSFVIQSQQQSGLQNQQDSDLCQDMLTTEKYISGTYDSAIFEFKNAQARNVLNHIQKEEQQHGEQIFNYMQNKGMYNLQ